jgi:hypothetical protein
VPFFTPDPTPGTGNLLAETTDVEYLHEDAASHPGAAYYTVRAVSIVGTSANSNHGAIYTFSLTCGSTP